jgi:hypothetical protein
LVDLLDGTDRLTVLVGQGVLVAHLEELAALMEPDSAAAGHKIAHSALS